MAKKIMVRVAANDPGKSEEKMLLTPNDPMASHLDIRDRLAELVGKGNNLNADDKSAIYGSLVASLGKDKAMKVMNHAYLFNTRPDVQKLPLADKLRAFYTIGSNDPDVNQLIEKSKSLGYGVVPGFNESSSAINQQLTGKTPIVAVSQPTDVQRKIMIKVPNK